MNIKLNLIALILSSGILVSFVAKSFLDLEQETVSLDLSNQYISNQAQANIVRIKVKEKSGIAVRI